MEQKLKQIAESVDCLRALMERDFESVENWCEYASGVAAPPDYLCMLEIIARACVSREGLDARERAQVIKLFAKSRANLCAFHDATISEIDFSISLDRSMLRERYGAIFE